MHRLRGISLAALLAWSQCAMAQVDSTRAAGHAWEATRIDTTFRTALLSLSRTVNSYGWAIDGGIAQDVLGGHALVSERLRESIIPETGSSQAERTDVDARLAFAYPVLLDWSLLATSSAQSTADNRRIGISDATRIGAMAGLDARLFDGVRLTAQSGGIVDDQNGIRDHGPQYAVELSAPPRSAGDYTLSGRVANAQEFLSPRRNATLNAEFDGGLHDPASDIQARIDVINTERDFYFPDSASAAYTGHADNIERRHEQGLHGGVQSQYLAGDEWRLRFDGDVTDRTVTRGDAYKSAQLPSAHIDTRVREFRLATAASLEGTLLGAVVNASMHYEQYEETHGVAAAAENSALALQQQALVESQKNSVARRTQLGAAVAAPVRHSDTLTVSATFGILHYDTPDTANTDDRDELDVALHAAYSTRPFPGCTWGVRSDVFMHHLVYLFAAQSGNNAWNRIIRLNPFIAIAPAGPFRTQASFDILGNYTVFDFESILESVHSYSYRQLELRDSAEYDLVATTRAVGFVDARWYEHGRLDYAAFRERPIDRVREWTYGAALQYRPSPSVLVAAGVRVFTRYVATYAGGGSYTPTSDVRAFGPTAAVTWPVPGLGTLLVDGWYETIREGTLPTRIVPNLTMTVRWGG